ncbi:hypothetical protein DPEC_G00246850 [Dallia pectoralis]|uniref:Uncharacterized protein n=1 Tax=Dallia pectoralis TaxID=75939 RepID=A0ACC2FWL3_DALPE|nr:hypothetical protein DPEC_G00246850 [Dallia pectoralis]
MGHIRSKDTVAPLRDSSTVAPQQVWLNVNHHCLTNRQKDISWMAVHGCLPTGEFKYRRHIALTVSCPHGCNTVENTYHVLAECSVARRVWALFVPSVSHNRLLTLPRLTTENILNGPPGGCTTTELRQQWRIIGVVKQVLWETRNIKVFNKTTVDPTTLRRRITILLRDHAITDFHKHPVTARAAWGGRDSAGGLFRSSGCPSSPLKVQYQRRTPVSSTQMADGAGCSQASFINDLRAKTLLWVGSLPILYLSPTAGPTLDPAPSPAPNQHPEEALRRDLHHTFALGGPLTGEFHQ